jgi:thiol-disulfide isomerase/thioredoxin
MLAVNPFNQYSFLLLAGGVLLTLTLVLMIGGFNWRKGLVLLMAAAAFLIAWLSLRTGISAFRETKQVEYVLQQPSQPVLVEFYSDYCASCLVARPIIDRLETDLEGQLTVIRLDIASGPGQELGARLGFRATPTFVLFDVHGNELWRSIGTLDPEAVRQALGGS